MKKVCIIPLLLSFLSLQVASQSKYSIGFHLRPSVTTTNDHYSPIGKAYPTFCYGFGTSLSKNITSRLDLESGLFYQQRGYGAHYISHFGGLTWGDIVIDEPGFIEGYYKTIYNYLDIPFKANFKLLNYDKAKIVCETGVITNLLLGISNSGEIVYPEELIRSDREFIWTGYDHNRFINLSLTASIGTEIAINEKYNLDFEAFTDYLLLGTSPHYNQRFLTIGISIGFIR